MKRQYSFSLLALFSAASLSLAVIDDDWAHLNHSVQGRLFRTTPLALPCFSQYEHHQIVPNSTECDIVRHDYALNKLRSDHPAGYMNLQSEMCFSDHENQCVLDNSQDVPPWPADIAVCNQGSVPPHFINVTRPEDIASALQFASDHHGVHIAIKNGAHDYLMRNSQRDGLSLWVRHLDHLEFHQDYLPQGCTDNDGSHVGPAITAGTGATTGDIASFADSHNATFVGGYSPTVRASGGWVLGGGHSILSPAFGLGADRVVEFEIVTPANGSTVITANACQNQDLFRALRGGGVGGAFGVVVSATHRVVSPSPPVAVASMHLSDDSTMTADAAEAWIALQANQTVKWARQGWGGHAAGTYMLYVNPLPPMNDNASSAAEESMRTAGDFVRARGGTVVVEVLPSFQHVLSKYIWPDGGAERRSGTAIFLSSRLVPDGHFSSPGAINSTIMEYVRYQRSLGFDPREFYCPVGTPYTADVMAAERKRGAAGLLETSVQPAWYRTLWSLSSGVTVAWNATYVDRVQNLTALTRTTRRAEELLSGGGKKEMGTYVNEANPFTSDWKTSWWGEEGYAKLLEVKKKYDPDGLLKCWKCIGFEDATDLNSERFWCQGRMQRDVDEQLSLLR